MSSGSDIDEFFDAEDTTPVRRGQRHQDSLDSEESEKFDIEEEERKLLELKKLAEQRRREEDEELERRRKELEEKRRLELAKQEARRKAEDNERRRQKLTMAREVLQGETSPIRAPPKPPRLNPEEPQSMEVEGEGALVVDAEMTDVNINIPGQQDDKMPSKALSEMMDTSEAQDLVHNGGARPKVALDTAEQEDAESDHTPTEMDSLELTPVKKVSEPDIVQSTKKEPPPRPVAPPRRKRPTDKKNTQEARPTSSACDTEEAGTSPNFPEAKGLPTVDNNDSTNAVNNLMRDLEQSLDLQSATSGHRHILATEEASSKAETTEEELSEQKNKDGDGASADLPRSSSNISNVKLEDLVLIMDKTGQKIPASMVALLLQQQASGGRKDEGGSQRLDEKDETIGGLQRPRSNSGSRYLTDQEILDQVMVLNLDTGERIPLSAAEEKLPRCMNPLALHIMRRTKEYSRFSIFKRYEQNGLRTDTLLNDSSLHKHQHSDDEENKTTEEEAKTIRAVKFKKKTIKIRRFFGKTVNKLKSVADEVLHGEGGGSSEEEEDDSLGDRRMIKRCKRSAENLPSAIPKSPSANELTRASQISLTRVEIKASSHHKGPYDFDLLVPVQDLSGEHNGAVWTMKFSHCGRLLATGGQDNLLRIWVLKDAYAYFDDMRKKYTTKVSPASSKDSLNSGSSDSQHSQHSELHLDNGKKLHTKTHHHFFHFHHHHHEHHDTHLSHRTQTVEEEEDEHAPFMRRPFCVYRGHTADLLDLSWSKNYFVLSSSMDKTVRLWHISRRECLCSFQHIDFVTAIAFHPKDDRYFLSGSLDGKLRLWNIPDKKVALWNEIVGTSKLITAANFCLGGRFAVCGTYDGRCIFYSTEQLKYYTQIHVRSTRGRNARGRKLTGIEPVPGEDKILVTSNDSRVRLYDLRDLTLTCKYKGCANNSSQIKASFSTNGKYIICGSEDHFVYIWKTQHEFYKFTSARRDRNDFWEGIKAHTAVVTAAIFAPNPGLIIKPQFEHLDSDDKEDSPDARGEVIVSADFSGAIKVFINKFKPGSG